jgi:PilZ domain
VQIEGPHPSVARVRTISLGGAFLESKHRLAVGDSLRLEIRAGLRRIHSTAVVRNLAPNGGGVEFVHMKQEDREKLRRLVHRLLRN